MASIRSLEVVFAEVGFDFDIRLRRVSPDLGGRECDVVNRLKVFTCIVRPRVRKHPRPRVDDRNGASLATHEMRQPRMPRRLMVLDGDPISDLEFRADGHILTPSTPRDSL